MKPPRFQSCPTNTAQRSNNSTKFVYYKETYIRRWEWCACWQSAALRCWRCRGKRPCRSGWLCSGPDAIPPIRLLPSQSIKIKHYALYICIWIPACVRLMLMSLPSSRRQRTVNGGVPVALQVSVTELCSLAVTLELLRASSILGGTAK